jgi:hypothetical protein
MTVEPAVRVVVTNQHPVLAAANFFEDDGDPAGERPAAKARDDAPRCRRRS